MSNEFLFTIKVINLYAKTEVKRGVIVLFLKSGTQFCVRILKEKLFVVLRLTFDV